jgi:hypothetical protein
MRLISDTIYVISNYIHPGDYNNFVTLNSKFYDIFKKLEDVIYDKLYGDIKKREEIITLMGLNHDYYNFKSNNFREELVFIANVGDIPKIKNIIKKINYYNIVTKNQCDKLSEIIIKNDDVKTFEYLCSLPNTKLSLDDIGRSLVRHNSIKIFNYLIKN